MWPKRDGLNLVVSEKSWGLNVLGWGCDVSSGVLNGICGGDSTDDV